ncbi:MAG: hypothetical protein DRO67_04885 [Candidatus Asgardarchaeum californiense]|nr:MAG: hypothetical protein DRO67_04885 [Candidatus Asgardarchaeum californiense]
METTKDNIESVIEQAFDDNGLDIDTFSRDIICFNEVGTKCGVVLDDMKSPKTFVMVCLGITLEREWKLAMCEVRENNYDGIDAMNLIHNYLEW